MMEGSKEMQGITGNIGLQKRWNSSGKAEKGKKGTREECNRGEGKGLSWRNQNNRRSQRT